MLLLGEWGMAAPHARRGAGLYARAARLRRRPHARASQPWCALLSAAPPRNVGAGEWGDTSGDTERLVRRCATAQTHGGVRVGRASRFLETPPTPATATPEGSRLARMGLTSGIGSVHDGVRAASLR